MLTHPRISFILQLAVQSSQALEQLLQDSPGLYGYVPEPGQQVPFQAKRQPFGAKTGRADRKAPIPCMFQSQRRLGIFQQRLGFPEPGFRPCSKPNRK